MEYEWQKAQSFEKNWWINARQWHSQEIEKGDIVGRMMMVDRGFPEKSVIDIGCGPFSLLQRVTVKESVGLDPIYYDDLEDGYIRKGIKRLFKCGEDLSPKDGIFDEAWIYNCLQHVKDPVRIIENAMDVSSTVRIFEWIHIPPYEGHIHELTPTMLTLPFKQRGWTSLVECEGTLNYSGLNGRYFMGVFSK